MGPGFESPMVHQTRQIRTYFFLKVRSDLFFYFLMALSDSFKLEDYRNSLIGIEIGVIIKFITLNRM